MVNSLKILVVSDLHIGEACSLDMKVPAGSNIYADNFKDKLFDFIRNEVGLIDYLICLGDLTSDASFELIEHASGFFRDICNNINIDLAKVIFVPGNHEVDWSSLSAGSGNSGRRAQRYNSIKYEDYIFKELMENFTYDYLNHPFLSYMETEDLIVLAYNSSWHDDPDQLVHHGKVTNEQMEELSAYLSNIDFNNNKYKFFLLHHHPISYANVDDSSSDFSQLQNSELLLNLLTQYKFDFILHGHIHQPRFKTYSQSGGLDQLCILSAGSLSKLLPHEWIGLVNNQLHLIEIDGRSPQTNLIQGRVCNWAYFCSKGWSKSEIRDGIESVVPFGAYYHNTDLRPKLISIINGLFRSKTWINYDNLIEADASLQYVSFERIYDILQSLKTELGFDVHDKSLNKMLLLKNEG